MGLLFSSNNHHPALFSSSALFYFFFFLLIISFQADGANLKGFQVFSHIALTTPSSPSPSPSSPSPFPFPSPSPFPSASPSPSPSSSSPHVGAGGGQDNAMRRKRKSYHKVVAAAPPLSSSPPPLRSPQVFNVLSFGAVGDGVSDDSSAFKSAFDSACRAEEDEEYSESSTTSPKNIVLVPRGYSFLLLPTVFTGSCKNGLIFQVEGSIVAPDGPESWPGNISKRQWLVFYKISGMLMQGGGVIDGRGQKWWDLPCKPHRGINGTTLPGPCDSPVAMRFFGSTDITLTGLTVTNSPEFHIRFDNCQSITVNSLSIHSPSTSPNTDGIHIENTRHVTIHNTLISNGDDCISIGSGSHDVIIRNVTCGPSHGISIGSLGARNTRACVSNVTLTGAVIKRSANGVRIKTWQGGYGCVSGVKFSDVRMEMVRNPIVIDQYYCVTKKSCVNQTGNVFVKDVVYDGIRGTYDGRFGRGVRFACSDDVPCVELRMMNVELVPVDVGSGVIESDQDDQDELGDVVMENQAHRGGGRSSSSSSSERNIPLCWNAYGSVDNSSVKIVPAMSPNCLMEGMPPVFLPGARESASSCQLVS